MIICPIKEYLYFLFFYFEEKIALIGAKELAKIHIRKFKRKPDFF
jgi:hypothetical protein